jgi:Beta-propeller repeat
MNNRNNRSNRSNRSSRSRFTRNENSISDFFEQNTPAPTPTTDETSTSASIGDALNQNTLALTPGSDFVFNFREDQFVWSRHGNDYIAAYNPSNVGARGFNIDVIIGDLLDEQLFSQFASDLDIVSPGRDTFVLGDWRTPYYYDGGFPGVSQFAIITDFSTQQDTIELYGSKDDYLVFNNLPVTFQGTTIQGSALLYVGQDPTTGRGLVLGDLLAFFPAIPEFGITQPPNLSLDAGYFAFQGTTPPEGPIDTKIFQIGTTGVDGTFSTSADPFGNLYVVGSTTGSLGGKNAGSYDAWFAKYDSNGNQQWIKQIGTQEADTAFAIKTYVTPTGEVNFYVTGTTTGDLGGVNEGFQDVWLGKFDSNGDQLWIQQNPQPLPGPGIDNSLKLDVDKDGNLYQVGVTVKENPPGSAVPASDDAWVAKYDPDGNLQWFREFTSSGNTFDEAYGVATSKDGGVYATGWTRADLGGAPIGAYDIWLTKLDAQGTQQWITKLGTENYEFPWGVDTDSQDNAYIAGWTRGVFEGDGSGVSKTNSDAWLTKYDPSGTKIWTKQFGTAGDDGLFLGGIVVDSKDNIFVTGFTDNDLGGTNAGGYDAWVAKYDVEGDQVWIKQFGTSKFEYPSEITVDNFDNVFITGYSQGSLGSVNQGSTDAWIAKLDANSGDLKTFNYNPHAYDSNARRERFREDNSLRIGTVYGGQAVDTNRINSGNSLSVLGLMANVFEKTINLAPLNGLVDVLNSNTVR